jgi:hypothetical protein
VPSTPVDEEMANATTGIQTANQVHTADLSSEPTHAVTGQESDGRAAEPILGGAVAPRATGRMARVLRVLLVQQLTANGADGHVARQLPRAALSKRGHSGLEHL